MPPRVISILCLIQVIGLAGACLLAAWFLKIHGKIQGTAGENFIEWAAGMKAARSWGLLLFLVPFATAYLCAKLAIIHRDIVWIGEDAIWPAIVVTAAVVCYSAAIMSSAIKGPLVPMRFLGQNHVETSSRALTG